MWQSSAPLSSSSAYREAILKPAQRNMAQSQQLDDVDTRPQSVYALKHATGYIRNHFGMFISDQDDPLDRSTTTYMQRMEQEPVRACCPAPLSRVFAGARAAAAADSRHKQGTRAETR